MSQSLLNDLLSLGAYLTLFLFLIATILFTLRLFVHRVVIWLDILRLHIPDQLVRNLS